MNAITKPMLVLVAVLFVPAFAAGQEAKLLKPTRPGNLR